MVVFENVQNRTNQLFGFYRPGKIFDIFARKLEKKIRKKTFLAKINQESDTKSANEVF